MVNVFNKKEKEMAKLLLDAPYMPKDENYSFISLEKLYWSGFDDEDIVAGIQRLTDKNLITYMRPGKLQDTLPEIKEEEKPVPDKSIIIVKLNRESLEKFVNDEFQNRPLMIKGKIIFDENSGKILLNDKECQIPLKTNQYFLCKLLFNKPFGKRVEEQEIIDSRNWKEDTSRSIYDAVRLVNQKIKKALEILDFFEWKKNTVWINEKYK